MWSDEIYKEKEWEKDRERQRERATEKSNTLISTEVSFNLELIRSFSLYDYH